MRIAVVSKTGATGGGASRFAEDLACWLNQAGHQADHLCAYLPAHPRPFQQPLLRGRLPGKICRYAHRKARQWGLNESLPVEYFAGLRQLPERYDVVHFHDHYTSYSLATAGWLAGRMRAFFTAHDCLHYSGNDPYPPLSPHGATSLPERNSLAGKLNRYVAREYPLTYIYPSQWLLDEARGKLSFKVNPVLLPYGFDPAPYHYQPRNQARQKLGLPVDRKIICVSANYLSDRRKGVEFALRAIAAASDLDPLVIFVGNPVDHVGRHIPKVNFWFAGYVEERERLGLLFAAADVFLFCSLQDNLPISIQETMGAATPMVGFASGGIPELIEDGKSGWLVPTGDQDRLNQALRDALHPKSAEIRGQAARAELLARFSVAQCVAEHEKLYQSGR